MENTKFVLPEAFKDAPDAEALKAVGQAIFDGVAKGMPDAMRESLQSIEITEKTIADLRDAIKKQGEAITKMKEQAMQKVAFGSPLQKAFFEQFDEIKANIERNVKHEDFVVTKAVDEHDPVLIQTTGNSIVAGEGATAFEDTAYRGFFSKRNARQYVRDIANISRIGRLGDETITFDEEGTEEGTFAVVTENGLKPQIFVTIIRTLVRAEKVAGYQVATEELMRNRRRAWAAIQRMFRNKLDRDFDSVLVDRMGENAAQYVSSSLDGQITNPGNIHAIIAAMAQISALEFVPDTIVMNPADYYLMVGNDKSPDGGDYLFLPMFANGGDVTPMGLRVILSNSVPVGTFRLGESGMLEVEEGDTELRVGYVNDDLIHNRKTFVLERWFRVWMPQVNAGSWIEGNFEDIKEAITAADA